MNVWALAGLFILWCLSVAGLVFMIRRWRLVEDVPAGKQRSREKTLADAKERLRSVRAKISPKTKRTLEFLAPLAQDKNEKMIVNQIKKWLSEKEDAKTKK
jgi:hypothetical protein